MHAAYSACFCVWAVAGCILAKSSSLLKEEFPGLIDGFYRAQPYFEISGYVHERIDESRLPTIITTDTTLAVESGQIGLFDTSTGYQRGPVYVAPHRTVTLHTIPVTGAVQQKTWLTTDPETVYYEWFSFFQLQNNATLLLQDLTVHINPASPLQVSPDMRTVHMWQSHQMSFATEPNVSESGHLARLVRLRGSSVQQCHAFATALVCAAGCMQ